MTSRLIGTLLLLALTAGSAAAQAPLDTTVVMDEVTVEAARLERFSPDGAERVLVLDAEAVEATGARDVAALLDARTGLSVRRYGAGGLATASLRGTGAAQTLVLLDGLRVADPQSGQVDLTLLPTVLLEGAEVVHGAASARYGSGGVGGVVRLHTLRPEAGGRLRLTSGAGAYGERRLGGVATGRFGPFTALVAAEGSRTDGDFLYTDRTLIEPELRRRRGAERSRATLFARLRCCGEAGATSLALWANDADRGLPGLGHTAADGARQWDRHLRLWAQHRRATSLGPIDLHARFQTTALRYRDAAGATDTSRTRAVSTRAVLRHLAADRLLLTAGAEGGYDHAALRGGAGQARLGTFAHADVDLGRVQLFPAARLDAYHTDGRTTAALSPQLGVNVRPLDTPTLRLKAHAGRAFRAPTLAERFWRPGGNPDLRPEHGWSAEGGVLVAFGPPEGRRLEAEVTGYVIRLRDQIVWQPSYAGPGLQVWKPFNAARVLTRGLEASLYGRLPLARGLSVHGAALFARTRAEDRSNPDAPAYGHQLRYVPRAQLKLHAGLAWRGLRVDLFGRMVGPRPLATDGSRDLPAYQVLDATLRYHRTVGDVTVRFTLGVDNLLDADYQVVRLYPMPPRHGRADLSASTTL